ncbi:MAG TPA: ATPase, T2SS/T4P/T4SS family [Acidimicrobiia bacterium]|nr:ATPase, T2SS/T4P/T4SS family [Acidimicrobiia bacterium]
MKRAFSFRNQGQDPPVEPLPEGSGADQLHSVPADQATDKAPQVEKTDDRDLQVVPEGGRFGELLVRKQLVTRGAIMEALLQQTGSGKRLGALLVDAGVISDRQLAETLAEQLNIPLADLRNQSPSAEAVAKVPERVARELVAVPLKLEGNDLSVVIADPTPQTLRLLQETTRLNIVPLIASQSEVGRVIDATYRAVGAIEGLVEAFTATDAMRRPTAAAPTHVSAMAGGTSADADAPVVKVVNLLIAQALRDRASDVHIEPQDKQIRVRFRVDGALHDITTLPAEMGPAVVSRIKIMGGMNIVERRRPQDGQTSLEIDNRALDVRIASTPTVFGEKVVMRLLDKSRPLYKGADLGMPADTHEAWSKLVRSPFGMVVCVGPTGSGKTTTLYATLGDINSADRNIMTIEDPVEYILPSINQIQINEQAGVTFADGLRSILRQDPDVILVGEIRDAETARIAVQSALTGHLVLSSLHATDTAAAVHRFLDMGIEAFLVASAGLGIVGQRLVRRICNSCKVPYEPTDEELAFYLESDGPSKDKFWIGEGCNFCAGTGYQERIGVYELLRITPEIKRLIVGWATQEEIRRMAIAQGMRTLLQEGLNLVANDTTSIAEVIRVIYAS